MQQTRRTAGKRIRPGPWVPLLTVLWLTTGCRPETPRAILPTATGSVEVQLELAVTPGQRSQGLMWRSELAEQHGMLFVFEQEEDHEFWMKNTPLPLDMIFLDSSGRIVGIVENARPFTETPRGVGKPSRYVLEVNGGFASRHGVRADTQARFHGLPTSLAPH